MGNDLTINADAGSPIDGQRTIFRIKDNGTARNLIWTSGVAKGFRSFTNVPPPTVTTSSRTTYVGCVYNSADSRWDVIAVITEAS